MLVIMDLWFSVFLYLIQWCDALLIYSYLKEFKNAIYIESDMNALYN